MQISLEGKHALIGGSSKGIGRAVAEQLARSGARVTLVARSEDLLLEITRQLESSTGRAHRYLVADYTDVDSYQQAIKTYLKENPVDILVNNTQGPQAGTGLEKTIDDYQDAFDLLFKSVVFTSLQALPHMQQQGWGRIINIASVSVREPLNYLVLSNSIRAAVVSQVWDEMAPLWKSDFFCPHGARQPVSALLLLVTLGTKPGKSHVDSSGHPPQDRVSVRP